jgi:hypothetical protein
MYICNDCGEVFEEFKEVCEAHPYGMGSAYETWCVCPYCESNDFDEAEECECCGEAFPKKSLTDGLCEECYEENEDD